MRTLEEELNLGIAERQSKPLWIIRILKKILPNGKSKCKK